MEKKKKKQKLKKFRLSAKTLFLTYPRTNLKPIQAYQQLEQILINWGIAEFLIVQEEHQINTSINESTHLHAYIKLHKKANINSPEYLHLLNNRNEKIKGKYETVKKKESVIQYLLKDVFDINNEDFIIFSKHLTGRISNKFGYQTLEDSMIQLAERGFIDKAMDLLRRDKPSQFMKSHMAIEKSLRALFLKKKGFTPKFNVNDFIIPIELNELLNEVILNKEQSLAIYGDSGSGKSQFIRAWAHDKGLTPLFVTHPNALKDFIEGQHNLIIMDDTMNLKMFTREALIHFISSQDASTHNVKHGSISIPETTRILLFNKTPVETFGELVNDSAIRRRIVFFNLGSTSLIPKELSDK
jgi:hypothetical protein